MRFEVYGSEGSILIDAARETGMRMFRPSARGEAGYVVEKADAATGWMYPTWDEHIVWGYVEELRHFATSLLRSTNPIETFNEGATVNRLIGAAYQSAQESRWIHVD